MAGGNAIRGTRVGAGPMGESERGEAAPRERISYFCSNGHVTTPSFASEAEIPDYWDCPRCGLPAGRGAFVCMLPAGSILGAVAADDHLITVAASEVPAGTSAERLTAALSAQLQRIAP